MYTWSECPHFCLRTLCRSLHSNLACTPTFTFVCAIRRQKSNQLCNMCMLQRFLHCMCELPMYASVEACTVIHCLQTPGNSAGIWVDLVRRRPESGIWHACAPNSSVCESLGLAPRWRYHAIRNHATSIAPASASRRELLAAPRSSVINGHANPRRRSWSSSRRTRGNRAAPGGAGRCMA